ncbi:MAG: ATP-binding protein [Anaerolineae bacterium]|nr:ATP-binding protein [Anaerolineae bacterium]
MASSLNPYNPLTPTEAPEFFFGQEETFAFFRQNLVGAPHRHALVLIGRRGLGKSSVLRQLSHRVDDRYRLCLVSLGALDLSGEPVFLAALVDEIRRALEEAEYSTYRLPDWPEPGEGEEPVDLREWFKTVYLDIAMTALRLRHLLLALDDAHLLLQAVERGALPADLLDYLRDVMVAHPRLDMVLALDEAFEDRLMGIELLNDPVLHVRLVELRPAEAERLVIEPVADLYHYEDGIVGRILAGAGGHPFLLHSICRLLFRRSEERHHAGPITENDLTAIQAAVLEQSDEILGPLWHDAAPNERAVLTALVTLHALELGQSLAFETIYGWLVGSGYVLNKTQLAAALRSLDYKGLIQMDADGLYRLPAGLIADWVNANTAVPVEKARWRVDKARLVPVVGLLAAILIVGALGAAALWGVFDSDDEDRRPASPILPTATLSLNLEATRQADFATQTEQARPTHTPTHTLTPTVTPSETPTPVPTRTRVTRTPTTTPVPSSNTPESPPTNTPRPSPTLTLAPGG